MNQRWISIVGSLRLPIIAAPMFLVSGPRLVIAACHAGVIGSFPTAYARTSLDLKLWLQQIEAGLSGSPSGQRPAPYAANLIVHPTNPRVDADLEMICEHKVPIVIASVGNPARIVERVHAYGGIVLTDIARVSHARKAIDSGVDGLILLCAGAGGHTGWINPFAFVSAVREFYDGPLILAGSITRGRDVYAAQVMGADLAYVGTPFIATPESDAPEEYREMLVRSGVDDVVLTPAVSGLPANWLKGSLERLGFANLKDPPPGTFSAESNFKAWRDVWGAGHGVGSVKDIASVADIVARMSTEYKQAIKHRPCV